ncbi:Os10g0381200 [Oryza sativa Japonica Group]|jgi:hypothetical protein|uniref:Uncharacterized protein n=3 Tax=Oryza sativa TaxID=4530 RepID=A0A8J8YNQ2_ORYSJ|nr:hypothetical protein OsI_33337 [Oryza sativa Indica Group]EEE50867.1 hypothetical protein OsJ_31322 [Oryza sativa Japonica Group]KAB8112565.1 hypothetical protein EE612_051071 [Oryza sativa]BAT10624.1 Os10g0381200 [Oryza sativa Japonica Group]
MVEGGPEDAWVPDHKTSIFVPADEAAVSGTENHDHCGAAATAGGSPSVLDQAMFVCEDDMEDVERPAVNMASITSPNEHQLLAVITNKSKSPTPVLSTCSRK